MNRMPELLLNYIDVFKGNAFPIEHNIKNITELVLYFDELQERISKAIEYIKDNDLYTYIPDNDLGMDYNELVNEKLLDILKGVDKE